MNETLAKSYEEEHTKLRKLLATEDIEFKILANQLNKIRSGEDAYKVETIADKSALILAIIEIFGHDYQIMNSRCIQKQINAIRKCCLSIHWNVIYQSDYHRIDCTSTFNVDSINDYLVNIEIKGDGNCLWSSVSHSLVGSYAMMKSLRLLTAHTLMSFSEMFSKTLHRQVRWM